MAAYYRMERNPDPKNTQKKMPLHPRLIPNETVSIKKLMRYAKSYSTFSEADISGALQLITDLVIQHLSEGDMVEIEGLGFFSVSLQSRPVMEKEELRSESVHFKNVNFRCCQRMKDALKNMPLTRLKESKKTSFATEEKQRRVEAYMENHAYLTVLTYRELTGTSDYTARKDLAFWVSEGILFAGGTRHMAIYTLPPKGTFVEPETLIVNSNLPE